MALPKTPGPGAQMRIGPITFAFALTAASAPEAQGACLRAGEPTSLIGNIVERAVSAPPAYHGPRWGDGLATLRFLRLATPICIERQQSQGAEPASPTEIVAEVRLGSNQSMELYAQRPTGKPIRLVGRLERSLWGDGDLGRFQLDDAAVTATDQAASPH